MAQPFTFTGQMSANEDLTNRLEAILPDLVHDSSGGLSFDFPAFELTPFNYLEFAEQELSVGSAASRIGCVSNLKRATECEMDTFIHILGLGDRIRSFPRKLEFIGKAGLMSPRSLEKLNQVRNKMEHEYASPDIKELDSYFDLASGFVHSLEGYIFMLFMNSDQEWVRRAETDRVALRVGLTTTPPQVTFKFRSADGWDEFAFNAAHIESYTFGLKAFFLMCRAIRLVSCEYVIARLREEPQSIGPGRNYTY